MAVLNLTPDSFYPASRLPGDVAAATAAAAAALEAGADALDLGAESTRPGSVPVEAEEEQRRLLSALAAVRQQFPEALLSVDTRHVSTARKALEAGADIINDVTGLENPEMARLVATSGCGAILMHHRGAFATMHHLPPLADPFAAVRTGLERIAEGAQAAGVKAEQIILDPGFGFGKNLDENIPVLARLSELQELGFPLLAGLSRKSFLRRLPEGGPDQRLAASLAAATAAVLAGVHWLRVHDVAASVEAAWVADRLLREGG